MVGAPGFELFGPRAEGDEVKQALVEAGAAFGLRQVGARTYPTSTLESGWIPSPCPAVYTGETMKAYRERLPASWYEGTASLGGSSKPTVEPHAQTQIRAVVGPAPYAAAAREGYRPG